MDKVIFKFYYDDVNIKKVIVNKKDFYDEFGTNVPLLSDIKEAGDTYCRIFDFIKYEYERISE